MTWIEALILGIVQGATEFFPISSSAHLKLVKFFLNIEESSQLFNLACHLGTLIALVLCFKKEILALFSTERKKLLLFFLALIPLIPGYLLLHPFLGFLSTPIFLGISLCVTSGILFIGNRSLPSGRTKTGKDVLCIGTAQVLALIPGISRSASTICCARLLGWEAKEAVRFSFLLSIPTILGGSSLEIFRLYTLKAPLPTSLLTCSIGFCSALFMGMLVVGFSLKLLEKGVLKPFAWYCLFIGALTLLLYQYG